APAQLRPSHLGGLVAVDLDAPAHRPLLPPGRSRCSLPPCAEAAIREPLRADANRGFAIYSPREIAPTDVAACLLVVRENGVVWTQTVLRIETVNVFEFVIG